MIYKEKVAEKFENKDCKELWNKISDAYDKEGEDGVKSILINKAEELEKEYQKVCSHLKQKL